MVRTYSEKNLLRVSVDKCSHIGLVEADLSDVHCCHLRGLGRQLSLEVSDGQRVCYASVDAVSHCLLQ